MPYHQRHQHRIIPLEGIYNMRDLGGLPTRDGHRIRSGKIFRSDSLHHLPEHSQTQLLNQGIRTVIDLRRPEELLHAPHVFSTQPHIRYHHVALRLVPFPQDQKSFTLSDLYQGILAYNHDLIREVLQQILQEPEAVVFHCRAGKDRTGLIAAIILDWLGVDHETIIEDYALTEHFIQPLIPEMQAERPPFIPQHQYDQLLETHPHAIREILQTLQDTYAGSYGFLCHLGFDDQQLQQIRHQLLERL
jgi:protein-tyrosine phosphatase